MLLSYYTVKHRAESELLVKKSKFIAHVAPVSSPAEAEAFILSVKEKHKEAAHNVYAYLLGDKGLCQKISDDGEPSGTAGKPILEVIKNKGLQDIVVVVTRYFGGKLLGAGGLIRAYGQCAAQGIHAAVEVEKVLHILLKIAVDYSLFGLLQRKVEDLELSLEGIEYTDVVTINVLVKFLEKEKLKEMFTNLTNGQAIVEELGTKYLDFIR